MKIFLSPAKRLNTKPQNQWGKLKTPVFIDIAIQIMDELRQRNPQNLEKIMGISSDIAEMNYERNQIWKPVPDEPLPAAEMFDGEVYRGFNDVEFSNQAKEYLKQNLYILSGLYGVLSPDSYVMPYRLEMGTKFWNEKERLDHFWKEKITKFINENTQKDEVLLNLSSVEYMNSLDEKVLKGKIYDVKFKDLKNGVYKQITVYFKKARGLMASFCAENNIQNLEGLKTFNGMGYTYNASQSQEFTLVFTRDFQ